MAEPNLRRSGLVAALQRFSDKYKHDPNLFPISGTRAPEQVEQVRQVELELELELEQETGF